MGTEQPTPADGTVDLNAETVESTNEASTVPLSEETAPTPHLMKLLYPPDTPKKLSDKFPHGRICKEAGESVLLGRSNELDVLLNDEHMARTFMELWCENQSANSTGSGNGNHDGPAWFMKNKSSKKWIRVYRQNAQQTGYGPQLRELGSVNGRPQSKKLGAEEQFCLQNGCELKLEGLTFIVIIEDGDVNTGKFDVEIRSQEEASANLNRQFSSSTSSGSGHSDLSVESASGLTHRPVCRNSSGSLTTSSGTNCSCGGACSCPNHSQPFFGTPQQCPGGVHNLTQSLVGLSLNGSYGSGGLHSHTSASSCPQCGQSRASTPPQPAPQSQPSQPVIIFMPGAAPSGAAAFQGSGAGPPPVMYSAPPPYSVASQTGNLASEASRTFVQTNLQQHLMSTVVKQQYDSAPPSYQQPYGFQGHVPQPPGQLHQPQGHLPQPQGHVSRFQGRRPQHQGQMIQSQGQISQPQSQVPPPQGQLLQAQGEIQQVRGQIQQCQGQGQTSQPFLPFQGGYQHQGAPPQGVLPSHGTLPSQGMFVAQGMSAQSGNTADVISPYTNTVTQPGNNEALPVSSADAVLQSADAVAQLGNAEALPVQSARAELQSSVVVTQSGNAEFLPTMPHRSVGSSSAFPELSSAHLPAISFYQQSFVQHQGQSHQCNVPPTQPHVGGIIGQSQSRSVVEPLHGPQSMPVCQASGIPQQAHFSSQPQSLNADPIGEHGQAPQQVTNQVTPQFLQQSAVQFPVQPESAMCQGEQVTSGQAVTSVQPSAHNAVRFPVQPESAMFQDQGQQITAGQLVTSACQGQIQTAQHSGQSHHSYDSGHNSGHQPFVTNPATMDPHPRVCTAVTLASSSFHGHALYGGNGALPTAPPVTQLSTQRFPTQATSQTPASSLSVARGDAGLPSQNLHNMYSALSQAGLPAGQTVPAPSGAQAGTFLTQTNSPQAVYLPHTTNAQTGLAAVAVSRSVTATSVNHLAEGTYSASSVAHAGSSVQAVVPRSSMLHPSSNGNTVNLRMADDIAPTPPPSSDFITLSSVGVHDLQAENRGGGDTQRRREPEEDDERGPTEHEDES